MSSFDVASGDIHLPIKPRWACIVAGLLPLVIRILLLPYFPVPQPIVHDEFSYLLGADTFASGRLVNPPHPFWQHFESFHVLQQPVYASKYPPMQALTLAAGQKLGHPWIGVWMSVGAMCAAVCWAMQGWLSPAFAFVGALLFGLRFGVLSDWMNSYWGGSVAALGGALVIGSLPRLLRQPRRQEAFIFCIGLVILANSRPFEGLLLAAPVVGALLFMHVRSGSIGALWRSAAIPLAAIVIPAALAMGYYNFRVTGHPLLLPYQLYAQQYGVVSAFYWIQPRQAPVYRHAIMKEFWAKWDVSLFHEARRNPLGQFVGNIRTGALFLLGTLPLLIGCLAWPPPRSSLDRIAIFTLLIYLVGLGLEKYILGHYLAPIAALVFVHFMNAISSLWPWRQAGLRLGAALAAAVLGFVLLQTWDFVPPLSAETHKPLGRQRRMGRNAFAEERERVENYLRAIPRQHLVFVRYGGEHSFHEEWVYNRAEIDSSPIVWARSMGPQEDRALAHYFSQRSVWLLEPDKSPVMPVSYLGEEGPLK